MNLDNNYTKTYSANQVDAIANELCEMLEPFKIILFEGDLGAGKTTLIKALLQKWKVDEAVTSPTFAIVNEYATANDQTIFHMDLYRLKNIQEAIEIGIDEMIESGQRCIIEWPEKALPFLTDKYAIINIKHLDQTSRKISVHLHE